MAGDGRLRVGLVGYGLAGRVFHAPLIASTPALRLAAIVTASSERREVARRDFPDARVLSAVSHLWDAAADLDLVVVAAPNRAHVPVAMAAVEAGLAVVVDKPLAASSADADRLVAAAGARGVPITVFQNRRWDGDFLTVRRLVDEGAVGTVARFESRFERWRPVVGGGWRESDAAEDAGGVLFDLGAHLVDQALQLFGPADAVYAELGRRRAGAAVDDDAFVALAHASGPRSHLWMSLVAAQGGPRFRLLGDRAAFTKEGLDGQEDALAAGARPGSPGYGEDPPARWGRVGADDDARPVPTERGRYEEFYARVAAALSEGEPLPVDPRDAVAALRVIEAARRSAAAGAIVRLERGPLPAS